MNKTATLAPEKGLDAPEFKRKGRRQELKQSKKLSKQEMRESLARLTCNTCSTLAKIHARTSPEAKFQDTYRGAAERMNVMRIGTPAKPPGGDPAPKFQMPRSPPAADGRRIDIQPSWRR